MHEAVKIQPVDLDRFIQMRRPRWERLAVMLDRVDSKGLEAMPPDDVSELYNLYRMASNDLNWAQTQTGNPALLDYLETTVGRAYRLLAPRAPVRPWRTWWRILRHDMPAVVRREWRLFAISTTAMVLGALLGWLVTAADPDMTRVFLPVEHLLQSPAQRVADLESQQQQGQSPVNGAGAYSMFSSFLFTHNIRVSLLVFGLGLTFGMGTVVLLFYNGVILGSIAQAYFSDGVFVFFLAWVGPHGSIELPCVIFAGAAGLMLGRAQWRVDRESTWRQIAKQRQPLITTIVATASLLVLAGLIEGGFSQINAPTLPYAVKIAVAALLFLLLLGYLFLLPVQAEKTADHG